MGGRSPPAAAAAEGGALVRGVHEARPAVAVLRLEVRGGVRPRSGRWPSPGPRL